jgi:hypothetical protein
MKSGWIKHFKDGQTETGFDHQVKARTASWRHGRLEGLVAVDMRHGPLQVTLSAGEGKWWQSDTLVSKFRGYGKVGETSYLVRRVQRQIMAVDVGKRLVKLPRDETSILFRLDEHPSNRVTEHVLIEQRHVGKWLTVVLDIEQKCVTAKFLDKKK